MKWQLLVLSLGLSLRVFIQYLVIWQVDCCGNVGSMKVELIQIMERKTILGDRMEKY